MKKIISILLVLAMMLSMVACGGNTETEVDENSDVNVEEQLDAETDADSEVDADVETDSESVSKDEEKEETAKPSTTPAQKPAQKPEQKPTQSENNTSSNEGTTASKTVGQTLLADFKARAAKGGSAQSIADGIMTNSIIQFMGGTVPVEPGYLTGFDNAEIKGFKEGVMFAPGIGTIPFVGYVFTLEDGVNVAEFAKTLKSNANPRWNICTTADETVVDYSGNKVFFLMCPSTFEQ